MRKIMLLLSAILFALNFVQAQSDWVSYKFDSKVSVKFPKPPLIIGDSILGQKTRGGLGYFIMKSFDAEFDSVKEAKLPLEDFASELKRGILDELPGYSLGDVKPGKWNGYLCYHLEGENSSKKERTYFYMIQIGKSFYELGVTVPDNIEVKGKDDFFNSLTLNSVR